MAVMRSKDRKDFIADCCCGCNAGVRIRIDKDDYDYYYIMSYTNGNFYSEQGETVLRVIGQKLKKIWAIVRNKDFYYAEISMNKDEFAEFREYINSVGG